MFTQLYKPAAVATECFHYQRHFGNKVIRKERRMCTWLKDGFFCSHLLQSMDNYHTSCSYQFLFLLVLNLLLLSPLTSHYSCPTKYLTYVPVPPPTCCSICISPVPAPQACFTEDPAVKIKAEESRNLVAYTTTH